MANEKKQARRNGFMAVAKAPTKDRPHRHIRGFGDSEADALIDLASRLIGLGAAQSGEADVIEMTPENMA